MASDTRKRNWAFILYPESAIENWKKILDDLFLPWLCSPLHDSDVDENGEIKKAHWHILLLFDGKKSYSQILDITQSVNGTIPVPISDTRKMVRYLVHRDNSEKWQYHVSDIINHSGNDLSKYFQPSIDEQLHISAEIMELIENNHITEFCSLENYIRSCHFDDWYYVLKSDKYFFDLKIRSLRNATKGISKSD